MAKKGGGRENENAKKIGEMGMEARGVRRWLDAWQDHDLEAEI